MYPYTEISHYSYLRNKVNQLKSLASGSVPKWSNGSGCKPDVSDFAGSSPARPTMKISEKSGIFILATNTNAFNTNFVYKKVSQNVYYVQL